MACLRASLCYYSPSSYRPRFLTLLVTTDLTQICQPENYDVPR